PDFDALIATCTSLPSRGPATRAFTVSRCETPYDAASGWSASSRRTDFTLSSSATISSKPFSRSAPATTTVIDDSGSRLRSEALRAGRGAGRQAAAPLAQAPPQPAARGGGAGRRPVGKVHRPPAGQAPPDLLGGQRQQRCGHPAHGLEHGEQGVEGRPVDLA